MKQLDSAKFVANHWNLLCTYDIYSPVHNILDACISILGEVGGGWALEFLSFFGPKWHSPISTMPIHRAQKTQEFQGSPLPLPLVTDMHASKTLCTGMNKL